MSKDLIDMYYLDNVVESDPLKVTTNDGTIIWEKTFWIVIYPIDWQGNILSGQQYLFDVTINNTNQPSQTTGTSQIHTNEEIRRYNEDNITIQVDFIYGKTWINRPVRISSNLPSGASSGYNENPIQISSLLGDKVYYALSKAYFSVTITAIDSDGAIHFKVSRISGSGSNISIVFSGSYYFEDSSGHYWEGSYYGVRVFHAANTEETYTISPNSAYDYDASSATPSDVYFYDVDIGQSENSDTWRIYGSDSGYR